MTNNLNDKDRLLITQVIEYLNQQAGGTFEPYTSSTIQLILDRYKDGYILSDFKRVIDKKCKEWLGTDSAVYLRPLTLFSQKNFENYLNAPEPITKAKSTPYSSSRSALNKVEQYYSNLGGDQDGKATGGDVQ